MIRLTFGAAKTELSRVCGASGMDPDDERVKAYTNLAIQELMNTFDMPSVFDLLRFRMKCGHIVLPSDYDRMAMCNVDSVPMQMQSPWFEFVGYGLDPLNVYNMPTLPGNLNNTGWREGVLDKEQVVTFEDIPLSGGPWYIRVGGTLNEKVAGVRPKILLQGYDADNNWIRSLNSDGEWRDGFEVEINGDTPPFYVQTNQTCRYLTGIVKPITKGNVVVWVTDTGAVNKVYIAQYAPKDTMPYYRQYRIPGLRAVDNSYRYRENCVLAYCRKRYVPITTDPDWLLIPNVPALQTMIQAIFYRESKDAVNYANYKAAAVQILKDEAKGYIGLQRQKPLFTVSESPGVSQSGVYIL